MMKNGFYVRAALPFVCTALLLTGCKTDGVSETQYVRLSDAACAFRGEGNSPLTIEVHANPAEWKAEALASWVEVTEVTATSFTVAVADNDSADTRKAEIAVRAGAAEQTIAVVQLAKDHVFPRYRCHPEFQYGTAMSPGGHYAGGFYSTYDEEGNVNQHPVIIDVATGAWTALGPYPNGLFRLLQTMCISDAGELVIACNDGCVVMTPDGNYFRLEVPADFTGLPEVSQVSSAGTWVGWARKNGASCPLKWVDGVAAELPKPALNYRDEPIGDVQARGISADGRIVYGTTWDNLDFGMVYWDEAGEVHYVGEDVRYCRPVERPDGHGGTFTYNLCDGMWTTATNTNVSPNGKYIAGTYRIESLSADGFEKNERNYPAFYNTETQKTVVFDDLPGGGALSATSDGLGFTADSTFGPSSGKVVDIENGIVLGSALEWIESTYGIRIPSGYITYMPDSRDRFLGAMLFTGGPVVEGINWYVGPAR